jgi:hypothetical protein
VTADEPDEYRVGPAAVLASATAPSILAQLRADHDIFTRLRAQGEQLAELHDAAVAAYVGWAVGLDVQGPMKRLLWLLNPTTVTDVLAGEQKRLRAYYRKRPGTRLTGRAGR